MSLAAATSHNTGVGKGGGGGALSTDLLLSEVMIFVAVTRSKSVEVVQCGTLWGVCHLKFANYVFLRWQNGGRADTKT